VDGGRGFGFTAGHTHRGWANDEQRKTLLNAILWTAKVEVPPGGVQSTVTATDIAANLDLKGRNATPPAPSALAEPAPPTGQPSFASPLAIAAQSRFAEAVKSVRRAYAEELGPLLKSAMTSGDLDEANAVNETKKILETGGNPPSGKAFKSLRANDARGRFEKALAAAQKRYGDELQGVVKAVLAAGNLDEANAINAEVKALGLASPVAGSSEAPKPLGAATVGRTAQGLAMIRYAMLPKQIDGKRDGAYIPYTEFGKPIGAPRTVSTISPWEKAVEENAVVMGFIRIDRPGTYEFQSTSDWDRNELWIDGKIVCPYRDVRDGKHAVELRVGLLPIVSVGYAHATWQVKVEWRPPGQAEWSGIPSALFSH
jgi:hypothetical protein